MATAVARQVDSQPKMPANSSVQDASGWQALPESVLTLEALAVYCQGPGKGRKIDLGGRHLRTSGGYETEFGFVWHEHPYPHWHLPLLSSNMGLRNGELLLCPRVMLVSRGTNMEFQNLRIFGKGEPEHDERNACAVIGSGSNLKLTKVNLSNVGFYAWENASATLLDCCVDGGLHGLLVWGRGQVQATGCSFLNAQKSGVCVQGGAAVTLKECLSSGSKGGSGVWAGADCSLEVTDSKLTNNAAFGAESNYHDCIVVIKDSTMEGNASGDWDQWKGGLIKTLSRKSTKDTV